MTAIKSCGKIYVVLGCERYIMFAKGLSIAEVSLRGGWYFTDITKAYEYLIAEDYTVSLGGKVLAGWDKQHICAVPKCKFISTMSDKKRRDFEAFMNHFRFTCIPY